MVVGVDPRGSILAEPPELNKEGVGSYKVEGIGYDFVPRVLDRSIVDRWVKTDDRESFLMARRLIREEGLLCGGSCGAAVCGALEAAQSLGEGQRCVVLLADSIRNYMSKFLSDDGMYENGFVDERITNHRGSQLTAWWARKRIADLEPTSPITITPDVTCREAIEIMSAQAFDMVPVQSEADGKVPGAMRGRATSPR